ncbi:dienelactone hydrolase family protein [Aspergillus sclerotioniger CBS 115572]|uniref:Dienelactone hydrolase family protein n=1 Tax=Aspergillus sclerotioniger CBS 115572 TaxID=1450535 RepID=A0A317V2S0_9EURO|nr:dienelactone hydrolase family protein [Aspergillus sclerotioniger CBS 115572]PWY67092.1 dienelactone hydrolase family protein [Aspergillus sclerotioniger CBS 115572]
MTANPPARCCTYVSYPPDRSTENSILFLTDAMGHRFINAQLIADQFAANGYFVVMPELFHGDPIPINYGAEFDIWGWYEKHLPPRVDPIVDAILGEMRTTLGCKQIGGVGYCFGGKYVCRYLKTGKLDAGFIAHPTMVEADEVEGIDEEILGQLGFPFQINLFSDVEHGFAVRCDLSQRRQKFAKEKAFEQAVAWFDEYVKE